MALVLLLIFDQKFSMARKLLLLILNPLFDILNLNLKGVLNLSDGSVRVRLSNSLEFCF